MIYRQMKQVVLIISVIFAVVSWLGESLVNFTILEHGQPFELIPNDTNEVWLRVVIFFLIVAFGLFAQSQLNKKMNVKEEKMRTLKATVNTIQDRVGNALSGIKLLLVVAEDRKSVDQETYRKATILADEALDDLRKLASLSAINEKKLFKDIYYLDFKRQ
jgi:predicted RND superfamily exporter protein